ncbi:hypothetical protein, partial [Pseudomonas putida]|uniref:hypothetical protein n=1 Tax=Pseudomonas putida TaxID=303 RepID=UPI00192E6239
MKVLTLVIFCIILALTLVVTYWAAKRTNTASEFYAAGGNLSAKENGFALAGDPALFTRALIERSEGTGCWHCLSGFASSARVAVEECQDGAVCRLTES